MEEATTHSKVANKKPACNVNDFTAKAIGDFGKWQFIICLSMALSKLPLAWYQLNIIFLAPPQDFWCAKPKEFFNYTDDEWRRFSKPLVEEHPCFIFDPELLLIDPNMSQEWLPLVACEEFVYNKTVFYRTITSDWDLVCGNRWLMHLSQVTLMWGILLGGIIFGIIADKKGRRLILMITIVIQAAASLISCVLPWFWAWFLARFILALASGGIGIISFVICMESVSGRWRATVPVLYQLPFSLGSTVMALLAYWLRDWRKLEFSLAILSSIPILYWFWIPESPRWLLATGQTEKALEVLTKAAKVNKRNNLKDMQKLLKECKWKKRSEPGFIAFLKSKNMRSKTLLLSFNWFCTGLGFSTFSQYLGMIGNNIFLTVGLSGIISVPGCLLCVLLVAKMGRKATLFVFQLTTTCCFVSLWMTPRNNDWLRLIVAGIGFGGLAGTVPALYLFSGELFPTVGRNSGVAGVTIFARIAAMLSPALVSLDEIIPDIPLILLAFISLSQIVMLMPLPETKGYPLPDTLEQAEQFKSIPLKKTDKWYSSIFGHEKK